MHDTCPLLVDERLKLWDDYRNKSHTWHDQARSAKKIIEDQRDGDTDVVDDDKIQSNLEKLDIEENAPD